MNFFPGASGWEPAILRNAACAPNQTSLDDEKCGVGGTISLSSDDYVLADASISFGSHIENATIMSEGAYIISGNLRRMALNIG